MDQETKQLRDMELNENVLNDMLMKIQHTADARDKAREKDEHKRMSAINKLMDKAACLAPRMQRIAKVCDELSDHGFDLDTLDDKGYVKDTLDAGKNRVGIKRFIQNGKCFVGAIGFHTGNSNQSDDYFWDTNGKFIRNSKFFTANNDDLDLVSRNITKFLNEFPHFEEKVFSFVDDLTESNTSKGWIRDREKELQTRFWEGK